MEQPHESDRFRSRRFARTPAPFDLGEVGRDDRDVVRAGEIHERRPGEEPGIQPQRAIGDEKIEA